MIREAIQAGDIVRDQWPLRLSDHVNLYMGSGRCGASFDVYGLMNNGFRGRPRESQGNTTLMHADHWHRGAFGLDYWLPVARLVWAAGDPRPPQHYRQQLRLYDGWLRTEMTWPSLRVTLTNYFHPDRRDLLCVDLRYQATAEGRMPSLLLAPETDLQAHYGQHLTGEAEGLELDAAMGWWLCGLRVGTADSVLALRILSSEGEADLEPAEHGVAFEFGEEPGHHLLLIGVARADRRAEVCDEMNSISSPEQLAAEAAQAWHRRWGDACIQVPVPEYQALWARSLFYVLSSHAPEVRSPAAPMGWAGNAWPFHFPQDLSFIHPALLRLGHLDIARSWIEFYRGYLDTTRAYTRRVYRAEGTMWAWEFPIGPDSQLLQDGSPNWCQYEIHNAAYPARMARETALHLRNPEWAREVAWPIVCESARFFGSILQREEDGTWGIHVEPSMGQDELGGPNAKNYLCALYSAQYCLRTALAMAAELGLSEPAAEKWRRILADGLSFARLREESQGLYATCEGVPGRSQLGRQKHPVQLNPLTFLPLGKPDAHVLRAYERRHDLCAGVRDEHYHGWTLAAYWLAASHQGDAAGLLEELAQALPGRYVDPHWIQIYESSGLVSAPFYGTSHGLYLQALCDALVSDYWGEVRIGAACPREWEEVRFSRLHTADGRVRSGEKIKGEWKAEEEGGC